MMVTNTMVDHKVDVIIPSYNYGHFLDEAIESVLSQSYENFCLTIMDNASTDDTADVVKKWQKKDGRVNYVRNEKNLGFHGNVEKGLSVTFAKYVAILPADDCWEIDFLLETVAALDEHDDVSVAYTSWFPTKNDINEKGVEKIFPFIFPRKKTGKYDESAVLLGHNWIPLSFGLFRRTLYEKLGGFSSQHELLVDYEFWLRMANSGPFYFISRDLGRLRTHSESWTIKIGGKSNLDEAWITIYDEVFAKKDTFDVYYRYLAKAREIQRLSGGCLTDIAKNILLKSEGNYQYYLRNSIKDLFFAVAEIILTGVRTDKYENVPVSIGESVYGDVSKAIDLLHTVIRLDASHDSARALLSEFVSDHDGENYRQWELKRQLQPVDTEVFAERMLSKWMIRPRYTFFIITERVDDERLLKTVNSLSMQLYNQWSLVVITNRVCSIDDFLHRSELSWVVSDSLNLSIAMAMVASIECDWIGFIEQGDTYARHMLLKVSEKANQALRAQLIYCDEDTIINEKNSHPIFKGELDLDRYLCSPYLGSSFFIRKDSIYAMDEIKWDGLLGIIAIQLNVLAVYGEGSCSHVDDVLIHKDSEGDVLEFSKLKEIVDNYFNTTGISAELQEGYKQGINRVVYSYDDTVTVDVVVLSYSKSILLEKCLRDLLEKSRAVINSIILVFEEKPPIEFNEVVSSISEQYSIVVDVCFSEYPFNYSQMVNRGMGKVKTDYALLLRDSIQSVQNIWVERLLSHIQRPSVGAVAPRLLNSEEGTIAHAGYVLGVGGVAGTFYQNILINDAGNYPDLIMDRKCSALSSAALLLDVNCFRSISGFNEQVRSIYADVEFGIRLTQSGFGMLWTPFSNVAYLANAKETLLNNERYMRNAGDEYQNRLKTDEEYLLQHHLNQLAHDPYINNNLSLHGNKPCAERVVMASWDMTTHDRPRILGLPLNVTAVGEYRIGAPLRQLAYSGLAHTGIIVPEETSLSKSRLPTVVELERLKPDSFIIHSGLTKEQIELYGKYKKYTDTFLVFDLEDLKTVLPEKNMALGTIHTDMKARLRRALSFCDRLLVITEPLIEVHRHDIDDIRVIPNYMENKRWLGFNPKRQQGNKPRVGWAGAGQHHGDLELIIPVVKELADEVEWVFMGMVIDELQSYVKEFHPYVDYHLYPEALSQLNLDLALAPLEVNRFNEAKSNIRLLEYGVMGWPVVCTDIHPYQIGVAPVTRLPNEPAKWIAAIRERISDLGALAKEGDILRNWVLENWMLDDHLEEILYAMLPDDKALQWQAKALTCIKS